MDTSQFTNSIPRYDTIEQLESQGATCDTFRLKVYGKLHFLKRLKPEFAGDIRYQEAFRKEFETGYRLEHPNLVRYLSLDNDGILMEYVDGETLSQRLTRCPNYFKSRRNIDKFVSQLLDVVAYLHSHQVLHLDLKPDNILLTRIDNDVKLIDLGCCHTDTFTDTTGRTKAFAAPEQLSGKSVDVRTDIYAIGRILECLPNHIDYRKVIDRCTAERPADRYQTVDEIIGVVCKSRTKSYYLLSAILLLVVAVVCIILYLPHRGDVSGKYERAEDTLVVTPRATESEPVVEETVAQSDQSPQQSSQPQTPSAPRDNTSLMRKEMDSLIDAAYHSTIACFCDSVFPPPVPSDVDAWATVSTEFRDQTLQIGDRLVEKYPNIPESLIRQEVEQKFMSLVSYVFNRMRENGK